MNTTIEVGKWYKNLSHGYIAKAINDSRIEYGRFWHGDFIDNNKRFYGKEKSTTKLSGFENAIECPLEEIQKYLPQGHVDKIASHTEKDLLEEARRRFPVGTSYININGLIYTSTTVAYVYDIMHHDVRLSVGEGQGLIYEKGKWGTIINETISTPENKYNFKAGDEVFLFRHNKWSQHKEHELPLNTKLIVQMVNNDFIKVTLDDFLYIPICDFKPISELNASIGQFTRYGLAIPYNKLFELPMIFTKKGKDIILKNKLTTSLITYKKNTLLLNSNIEPIKKINVSLLTIKHK